MSVIGTDTNQPFDKALERQRILGHIRSIFDAYMRKDREAIRRTHSADWVGFLAPSTGIERGIDAYMAHADRALQLPTRGAGYELLDTEVQFHGAVSLVYYLARWDRLETNGAITPIFLRSIDVYRRDGEEWIQCGSHITGVAQPDLALDGTRPARP